MKPPSGRDGGTVAAPKAESADEPGSRFGTLEITSRKGGKLQRPVKPEKQGADVSRKTGSHDGPERGWPREPRGSLEAAFLPCATLGSEVASMELLFEGSCRMGTIKSAPATLQCDEGLMKTYKGKQL